MFARLQPLHINFAATCTLFRFFFPSRNKSQAKLSHIESVRHSLIRPRTKIHIHSQSLPNKLVLWIIKDEISTLNDSQFLLKCSQVQMILNYSQQFWISVVILACVYLCPYLSMYECMSCRKHGMCVTLCNAYTYIPWLHYMLFQHSLSLCLTPIETFVLYLCE